MRTWSVQGLTSRVGRRTPRVRSKVQRVLAERKSVSRRPHDVTSMVHGVGRRMHRVGGEARGVGHRRTGVAQRVPQRARESTAACARECSGVRGDCRAVCLRALDVPTLPRSRVGPNDLGGSSPDVQCVTGREAWTGERVAWRLARLRWCSERRTWLGEPGAVVLACRCVATIETRRGAPLASRVARRQPRGLRVGSGWGARRRPCAATCVRNNSPSRDRTTNCQRLSRRSDRRSRRTKWGCHVPMKRTTYRRERNTGRLRKNAIAERESPRRG